VFLTIAWESGTAILKVICRKYCSLRSD